MLIVKQNQPNLASTRASRFWVWASSLEIILSTKLYVLPPSLFCNLWTIILKEGLSDASQQQRSSTNFFMSGNSVMHTIIKMIIMWREDEYVCLLLLWFQKVCRMHFFSWMSEHDVTFYSQTLIGCPDHCKFCFCWRSFETV